MTTPTRPGSSFGKFWILSFLVHIVLVRIWIFLCALVGGAFHCIPACEKSGALCWLSFLQEPFRGILTAASRAARGSTDKNIVSSAHCDVTRTDFPITAATRCHLLSLGRIKPYKALDNIIQLPL